MAAGFREGFVEADGFRIRYMEAGEGPALVHLHRAGGLRLTPAHELLSRGYRVVAFEMPGFGASAENTRTRDMASRVDEKIEPVDRFLDPGAPLGPDRAMVFAARQDPLHRIGRAGEARPLHRGGQMCRLVREKIGAAPLGLAGASVGARVGRRRCGRYLRPKTG